MLLRQKPKDVSKFIRVSNAQLNMDLQMKGYHPRYMCDGAFYYVKSRNIMKHIKEMEVK